MLNIISAISIFQYIISYIISAISIYRYVIYHISNINTSKYQYLCQQYQYEDYHCQHQHITDLLNQFHIGLIITVIGIQLLIFIEISIMLVSIKIIINILMLVRINSASIKISIRRQLETLSHKWESIQNNSWLSKLRKW